MSKLSNKDKLKYQREQRKKKLIEADRQPEIMLQEEIDKSKRRIGVVPGAKDPIFYTIRATV